jgi:hypothetical protein
MAVRHDPAALAAEVERLRTNCGEKPGERQFQLRERWNQARTEIEFLYRHGQLICDGRDLDAVLSAFDRAEQTSPSDVSDGPFGIKVLHIGDDDPVDVADALADALGDDDVVTPNHVLDAQGHPRLCPATEPVPWHGPVRDLDEPVGAGSSRIAVVDTGFLRAIADASGYARFTSVDEASETDDAVYVVGTEIRPYGGHGTATTGALLSVSGAESVTVTVSDCLVGGAVDELTITEDLDRAISTEAEIVSVQAGLFTRTGRSPKAFNAFYREVFRPKKTAVLVAAAGNAGTDRPFWPAAYGWCTAVGALTHGGDARTGWTNYGHWVDVYASGENIVVPFPNGTYNYLDSFSAEFTQGHAIWSGTSFATPFVAGMIARRMVERNISAPKARDVVLAEAAVAALPATGPRVLV